jgi:hypothetical protein
MLVVEAIERVPREHFVKGKPIKEIVGELRVSRDTVRKVLCSGAIYFEYTSEVKPLPKVEPRRADLDRMLMTNKAKRAPSVRSTTLFFSVKQITLPMGARGYVSSAETKLGGGDETIPA